MSTRSLRIVAVGLGLLAIAAQPPARAAMKIRQPILEAAPPPPRRAPSPVPSASRESFFTGEVIFVRGSQLVAEIEGGARERERFVVYDASLRRRGRARVVKALEEGVYLLEADGVSAAAGDHLARESEGEAAARVLRDETLEGYREFLALFPASDYRPRIAREMFRLVMRGRYPTFPGSVIEGRIELAESVDREVSLGQMLIVLDRFVIARTDERGRFRIEGIPKLEEAVELTLRVKDAKFEMADEAGVTLPAGAFAELSVQAPVRFTPTVLAGRVLDARGGPLAGAEVWTYPYTMEVLTDEAGTYRLSRRKESGAAADAGATDQPLFGGEYEVYAYRKGYRVERTEVSAESYQDNPVPAIALVREDPRQEPVPELGVGATDYLTLGAAAAPRGGGPKINP